jgi:hypothetical protein
VEETRAWKDCPSQVLPYRGEILGYLVDKERALTPVPELMSRQRELSRGMRALLLDWLVDIHLKFKLVPETLFLTANLIDRYLQQESVSKRQFQLLGVTALLVASKCEDIYAPHIRDLVYFTDNSCTREEVLEMEGQLLLALGFELTYTCPLMLLQELAQELAFSPKLTNFAKYLLELALL